MSENTNNQKEYFEGLSNERKGYTAFSNAKSFEEYENQAKEDALDAIHDPAHDIINFDQSPTLSQSIIDNTDPNLFRPEEQTSLSNALLTSSRYNDTITYIPSQNTFLIWDGQKWTTDHQNLIIERFVQSSMQHQLDQTQTILDEEEREQSLKFALFSMSNISHKSTIHALKTLKEHWRQYLWYDFNTMLLPVSNCAIDLKTKSIFPHIPSNRNTTTLSINYDPSAACPIWISFLNTIFNNNQEIIKYIQRVIGYSLTGETIEQCVFFLHGKGSNGKSTFLETIGYIMGDYFKTIPIDILLRNKSKQSSDEIAQLAGKRFVTAAESDKNEQLDESMIKSLTGSDTIKGRYLYKSSFDFTPQFKLFINTNHKPKISGQDHGIWRRIKLIPFNIKIKEEDKDLQLINKLKLEASGILNWALDGCLSWQSQTLNQPSVITEATRSYKDEEDILSDFIHTHILVSSKTLSHSKLMAQYKGWCINENIHPQNNRAVAKLFKELGYQSSRNAKGLLWLNMSLNTHQG